MMYISLYNYTLCNNTWTCLIAASQKTLSTLNTTMHDYRRDMERQVDVLERDLKVRKI